MSKTKLPHYLWPKGRSSIEPNLMPNVNDSDGNTVLFNSDRRKTTEATVVNLGDSPNSNNGDPLRTAFAKINNFIEATYWWDEGLNQKFRDIDSDLNSGISFTTDSDERYTVAIGGDSKIGFKGTPNQIEVSTSRKKSINNSNDWDSEVNIKFQLTETVDISTLRVSENATFDSDVNITGQLTVSQQALFKDGIQVQGHAQFDSDVHVLGSAQFDSELNVMGDFNAFGVTTFDSEVTMNSTLSVAGKATFDSEIVVAGTVTAVGFKSADPSAPMAFTSRVQFDSEVVFDGVLIANKEATFNDDVVFMDNAYFDSDVMIKGALTVNGTTTYVNSQNLEVKDNFIVINKGQATPFNDTGIIFQRFDSDAVSTANWNAILEWDETDDSFIFGQTDESGILPNPALQNPYLSVGNTIEMYDSDNQPRLIWDKDNARLSILNKDGTEAFAFDADSGQMEGNGNIDGGLF